MPVEPVSLFQQHRTLVLNANRQPLGYPLHTLGAEDTVCELLNGRFDIVELSDVIARSPSCEIQLPSVVALKRYIDPVGLYGTPTCSLGNLYVRDLGRCQYTGKQLRLKIQEDKEHEATKDHVTPLAQSGPDVWENVVLASFRVNNAKGNRCPEQAGLKPVVGPWQPKGVELLFLSLEAGYRHTLPPSWQPYLQLKPTPQVARVIDVWAKAA